jgi:hypothetical protein
MKVKTTGPTGMSREEELRLQAEFIEKNGITKLPPDERLFEDPDWNRWAKEAKQRDKERKLELKKKKALAKMKKGEKK